MDIVTPYSQKDRIGRSAIQRLLILLLLFFNTNTITNAQVESEKKAIDLLLVIDNSCSMFPAAQRLPQCDVYGNDPNFLRIIGSDIFLARLGFGEPNEALFQIGVVNLGENSRVTIPLQPLSTARDELARAIADPQPELATQILPALEAAYRELRTSPNRRTSNLPAIVLISDGIPYPREGQSNAELEQLVSQHPDIPLFIMLLQNPAAGTGGDDYEQYIDFWQELAQRNDSIFTYEVESPAELENTYNTIVAELQNTIPVEGSELLPGVPFPVFVDRYVQRIDITIIHKLGENKGTVVVTDPTGREIDYSEAGVRHFKGVFNPAEVISISAPRLDDSLKGANWTILSDELVTVFIDRVGAYRVNFLAPNATWTGIGNIYRTVEQQSPTQELVIRFNLLDAKDAPVTAPQPIRAEAMPTVGDPLPLVLPTDLQPDANGVYEIRLDPLMVDSTLATTPGFLTLFLSAGAATTTDDTPITSARLRLQVGRTPILQAVTPNPTDCRPGQTTQLTVTVGDADLAMAGSLQVRVFGKSEVLLTADTAGTTFSGDISPLCEAALTSITCGTQNEETLQVRLSGTFQNGASIPSNIVEVALPVIGAVCTPVPTPSPTPLPPPTPTPIPDSDRDGLNDLADRCTRREGWAMFDGCPPPLWFWALVSAAIATVLLLIRYFLPFLIINVLPPPKGYLLVCKKGERNNPISLFNRGKSRRTRQLKVGSNSKKAHIVVSGLKPIEFVILEQNGQVVVLDEKGVRKAIFDANPTIISTSNPDTTLRISLEDKLRC